MRADRLISETISVDSGHYWLGHCDAAMQRDRGSIITVISRCGSRLSVVSLPMLGCYLDPTPDASLQLRVLIAGSCRDKGHLTAE